MNETSPDPMKNRRPLATRQRKVIHRLVDALLRTGITPDQISAAGIVAALLASLALMAAPGWPWGFLVAGVFIQLRLLANLLDGLVAVEGGRAGRYGALWNELPDRLEDTLILAGFGFATGSLVLGLCAGLAAFACANVRLMGGALGQNQSFIGPMAKQHRMAAITLGCLIGLGEGLAGQPPRLAQGLLWLVLAGSMFTIARRIRLVARGIPE